MELNTSTGFQAGGSDANLKDTGLPAATDTFPAPVRMQPSSVLADGSCTPSPDLNSHIAASLSSGPVQIDSAVPELTGAIANEGVRPFCAQAEAVHYLAPVDKLQIPETVAWRAHNELLAPARLVEVAHAALQSSGFRRWPTAGTQQHDIQSAQTVPAPTVTSIERSSSVKRDLPDRSGCGANGPHDTKRPRNDACEDAALPVSTADPALKDAVAWITNLPRPPLAMSAKREVPPLRPPGITSPFARPQNAPSSGCGSLAEGAAGPAGGGGDSSFACGSVSGPMKSAFAHAASLPTEWQPGYSVTTGRRSARSPAPKGSRNLSIMRATSAETNFGPVARRGSGLHAPTASTQPDRASPAAATAAASGVPGGSATATAPAAAASAEHGLENGATGSASAGQRGISGSSGSAGIESAASADLRRLAQLAEAAAMLEEQMVMKVSRTGTGGGGSAGGGGDQDAPQAAAGRQGASADASGNGNGGGELPPFANMCVEGGEQVGVRHRAVSLTAAGLWTWSAGQSPAELRPAASVPAAGSASYRPAGSHPGPMEDGLQFMVGGTAAAAGASGRLGSGSGGVNGVDRSFSPDGDEEGRAGARPPSHAGCEGASEGGSLDGEHAGYEDEDGGCDGNGDGDGDGSNDSGGGGSSGGGRGASTLTERYRAVLKASAKQRGRGQNAVKMDCDKPARGSNRNGLCARIASITKERLQQVYHLNIEEAARELGIGMTKLKEHCRTLGIPRWPSRKLKSMDKLIESLNERAMTEPATKEVIADILAEIESFKRAIYENPCLEVEEDIKRLRQSNFKKEYQQRQVEQRLRGGGLQEKGSSGGSGGAVGHSGGGRSSQGGGGMPLLPGGGPSGALPAAASLASATSVGSGTMLTQAMLPQQVLPASLAANLGPTALMSGQLAAATAPPGGMAAGAQGSAQLVQVFASAPAAQQLAAHVSLLAPGQLQQLLMAQLHPALQEVMAQRALGGIAPQALLMPGVMPHQMATPQPQLGKQAAPMAAMVADGEAVAAPPVEVE